VRAGVSWITATDPGIVPNDDGLPGLEQVRDIVGALQLWGLVACVAAVVIGGVVWALGSNGGNPHAAGRGKITVVAAAVAALLIGGANAIIAFFADAGSAI